MIHKFWLSRYTPVVAASALILVAAGAVDAPDSGTFMFVRGLVAVLGAILGIWLCSANFFRPALGLTGILVGAIGIDLFLSQSRAVWPRAAGIAHSCVLCAIFSLTVSIALLCSKSWDEPAVLLEEHAAPSLRSISIIACFGLAAQIALGASFRRDAISITPHIVGAMLAAAIILYLVMAVLTQYSSHRELKNPAILLTGLIVTQVLLGIGAFLNKLGEPVLAMPPKFFSEAHIVTGSLTLAAAVILAMRIHRHIRIAESCVAVIS